MLAMSPLFPSLGWEYPMEIGTQGLNNLDNWNLDGLIIPNNNNNSNLSSSHQAHQDDHDQAKRSESPQSASSADHFCETVLAKKRNHNASERDRRKKINYLYSTLRSLLPANDHTKKLSIPVTVGRVLKYIPELQKEVDVLIHRKDELLSKISQLQVATSEFTREEKPRINDIINEKQSCSISVSKLRDGEIIIQISTIDNNIPLPEVLLKLEKDGLLVLDVSSFRSFGGSTFYNIHLLIEGANNNNNIKCEKLNEELSLLIEKHNMKQNQAYY